MDRDLRNQMDERRAKLTEAKALQAELRGLRTVGYHSSDGKPSEIDVGVYGEILAKRKKLEALWAVVDGLQVEIDLKWRPFRIEWIMTRLLDQDDLRPSDLRDHLSETFSNGGTMPRLREGVGEISGVEGDVEILEGISDLMKFGEVRTELEKVLGA